MYVAYGDVREVIRRFYWFRRPLDTRPIDPPFVSVGAILMIGKAGTARLSSLTARSLIIRATVVRRDETAKWTPEPASGRNNDNWWPITLVNAFIRGDFNTSRHVVRERA